MKSIFLTLICFLGSLSGIAASAAGSPSSPSAAELFERAQAVFNHFELPPEPEPEADLLQGLRGQATLGEVQKVLPYLDFSGTGFSRFSALTPEELIVFQDASSRQVFDFSVPLNPEPSRTPDREPFKRILASAPGRLEGLRIAIDPGHMGGDLWDRRTEKYVVDSQGNRISEGVIALETSLLLERRLQELGAKVFLTRRELAPVTDLDYNTFALRPWAEDAFRQSSLLTWFQQLLSTGPAGPELYGAFSASPDVRDIFSESKRPDLFILKADLDARVKAIENFAPDLTLVIHFDTAQKANGLSSGYDGAKAYIPGAFLPDEMATRAQRLGFVQHLVQPKRWWRSVALSSAILTQIRDQLKIPSDASGGSESVKKVAPGVFARNLFLTRSIHRSPISYLECFFYNDPSEFRALLTPSSESVLIGKTRQAVSARLVQLAIAIRDGILDFASHSAPSLQSGTH